MKKDCGPRRMFLGGSLLTQLACAGRTLGWAVPQGTAVYAGVIRVGVTCLAAPLERRVVDKGD